MPRITKAHMKESIVSFANDAIQIIKENLNLNDLTNREDKPTIVSNGWVYYVHKSIANIKPEIRIRRQNYRQGNTHYFKDQPKGNRINEEAWIYKEGMNCRILGLDDNNEVIRDKDHGFIIDGFSVQDYSKTVF
jgi:hypothetical protein